jgi:predicted methyltransferase
MPRRLEDRIQQLCARVVASEDDEEIKTLCFELREALSEHARRLSQKIKDYPVTIEKRWKDKGDEQ